LTEEALKNTHAEIVKLAFSLLPDSPDQLQKPPLSLKETKLTKREDLKVKPKDEEEALKTLQEWWHALILFLIVLAS